MKQHGRNKAAAGWMLAALAFLSAQAQSAHAQTGTWQTVTQPGGYQVARVVMSGGATGIAVTCERGAAVIAINLAQTPRRNPAQLTLSSGGQSGNLAIIRNGNTNVWVATVKDKSVLDMLAGGQSVAVAVDGAGFGTASLAGADAAMRGALGGCWTPTRTVAAAAPAGKAFRGTLKPGTYVNGINCKQTSWDDHYGFSADGYDAVMFIDQSDTSDPDRDKGITPLGETSFALQYDPADEREIYTYCAPEQLSINAQFFSLKERKTLTALPIKPGYYRAIDVETGKPISCFDVGACSYFLVEPARVASVTVDYGRDGQSRLLKNTIARYASVSQVGPHAYEAIAAGNEDAPAEPYLVTAPDKFRSFNGELGVWEFSAVDPKTIPAAQKPHF